jgi:hypothetical protein
LVFSSKDSIKVDVYQQYMAFEIYAMAKRSKADYFCFEDVTNQCKNCHAVLVDKWEAKKVPYIFLSREKKFSLKFSSKM